MRFLITNDWHLRFLAPEHRVDNFYETQRSKVLQIFDLARAHKVRAILHAGDLFDSANPSKYVISEYIKLFKKQCPCPFYTVIGQHDINYRALNLINRSAPAILESSEVIYLLGITAEPTVIRDDVSLESVALHGLSFGQTDEVKSVEGAFNVLVAHVSVGDRELFPGHKLTAPRKFLEDHPGFDLCCVGDYHYRFSYKLNNQVILNAGTLVRKSTADKGHRPGVFIFDTQTREYELIPLTIRPDAEVFDATLTQKPSTALFDGLLTALASEKRVSISFDDNLAAVMTEKKVKQPVRDYLARTIHQLRESSRDAREIERK